LKKLVEQEC